MPRFALRVLGLAVGCGWLTAPAGVLRAEEESQAAAVVEFGRQIFEHNFSRPESWKGGRPLGDGGDGLGPQFNDVSCVACHKQGGVGGGGPLSKNVRVLSYRPGEGLSKSKQDAVLRQSAAFHPDLSATRRSTPLHSFHLPQPDDRGNYDEHLAKLFDQVGLQVNAAAPQRQVIGDAVYEISQRNTTAIWGDGAIEAFRQGEGNGIRRHFIEEQNRKFPWLSGRVPRDVRNQESWFGWRGQTVGLHEFNLGACTTEMGLTVTGMPQHGSGVDGQAKRKTGLDLTDEQTLALTAFVASLPIPRQVLPTAVTARERIVVGEQIFNNCHCNACHCRDLGGLTGIFSDMSLHDMGLDLCDLLKAHPEILEGEVIPPSRVTISYYEQITLVGDGPSVSPPKTVPTNCECEWKTPPLWGCADTAPYLHDGRAATLDDAILLHGGEAETSQQAYRLLPPQERLLLIEFLQTLRAPQTTNVSGPPQVATAPPPRPQSHPNTDAAPAAEPVAAGPAVGVPAPEDLELPRLEPKVMTSRAADALQRLCLELKPGPSNIEQARTLSRQLASELPEPGAAEYALALFLERSQQHTAAITELKKVTSRSGVYAVRARQSMILDNVRRREFAALMTAVELAANELAVDATLAPHDAAAGARWLGIVLGWLSGPANIDVVRYQPAQVLTRVESALPEHLRPHLNTGAAQVQSQWESLLAEREALCGLAAAQQRDKQADLTQKQGDLAARQVQAEQSHAEAKTALDEALAQLDPQLADLEKQYAERDGVEQTLAARISPLEFRSASLLATLAQTSGDRRNNGINSAMQQQLRDAINELLPLRKQREQNEAQSRIIVIKAQQLAVKRAAAVAEYSRITGQAARDLQSISQWQKRFDLQAAQLEEATGNPSRRVQLLDRRIRELSTYTRFDPNQESQLLLARYRAQE